MFERNNNHRFSVSSLRALYVLSRPGTPVDSDIDADASCEYHSFTPLLDELLSRPSSSGECTLRTDAARAVPTRTVKRSAYPLDEGKETLKGDRRPWSSVHRIRKSVSGIFERKAPSHPNAVSAGEPEAEDGPPPRRAMSMRRARSRAMSIMSKKSGKSLMDPVAHIAAPINRRQEVRRSRSFSAFDIPVIEDDDYHPATYEAITLSTVLKGRYHFEPIEEHDNPCIQVLERGVEQ